MMRRKPLTAPNQKAFTIVELMIATSILSVILVLVTAMMISIGNLYYKGASQTSLQDNIRNVVDELSQDLQLNGSALITSANSHTDLPRSYCIGTTRYTYILGKQITTNNPLGANQSYHVLWRDTVPAGTCPDLSSTFITSSSPPTSSGTELVSPNSMLTGFSITTTAGGSPFTIVVNEANASSDLLCDTVSADCSSISMSSHVWDPNAPLGQIICKGLAGTQFCATADLTVTVSERL
jgi:prepilin-type N-terminal cleavage/methylation domain-containing protein